MSVYGSLGQERRALQVLGGSYQTGWPTDLSVEAEVLAW